MRKLLLLTTTLVGAAFASPPANATLQLSISDGTTTFSCKDGQLGCDLSGGANNLLAVDTTLDGFFVQITLAQSTFGSHNVLQLSSSNIENNGALPGVISFVASDNNFVGPVSSIESSGSLTFNQNIGAANSTLAFWADPLNTQGANPLNTPGTLLESVSGAATTDPDSFSGTKLSAFSALGPFSMTEGASLALNAGGSITGYDQSMTSSSVPEPSTWAMFLLGFAGLAFFGSRRRRNPNIAAFTP
jgi:hypothetical protein